MRRLRVYSPRNIHNPQEINRFRFGGRSRHDGEPVQQHVGIPLRTDKINADVYRLSIFFVSYALFEPISNILLKRMRPRIYIPLIMICWGIVMLCMGFVKDYHGMMAARWYGFMNFAPVGCMLIFTSLGFWDWQSEFL